MRFNELRLAEPIVRAVAAEGYTTPTPIQKQAIPEALAGRDILGCAQTGTGKTGAFALPILHRLAKPVVEEKDQRTPEGQYPRPLKKSHRGQKRNGRNRRNGSRYGSGEEKFSRKPRALILCPTRELASQIHESFNAYGCNLPLKHAVIFGGVNQYHQVRALHKGVDVLVATPGRLLDLMGQGYIDLSDIEVLVLDEADQMLDMGFIHDIRKLVKKIPSQRQTLLFSATMPAEIRGLADTLLSKPISVQAAPVATPVEAISQAVYLVTRENKPILLERLLQQDAMERTLIFTRTKSGADRLVKTLNRSGIKAGAIHSNKSQGARTRIMNSFKAGRMPVLIATDIASRGIDVNEISHVVNFDMPNMAEIYVHRIGRTARAGASGIALSFCDHDEISKLHSIQTLIGKRLDVMEDEPDLVYDIETAQRKKRSRRQSPQRHASDKPRRRRRGSGGSGGSQNNGNSSKKKSNNNRKKQFSSSRSRRR